MRLTSSAFPDGKSLLRDVIVALSFTQNLSRPKPGNACVLCGEPLAPPADS
jgi:hypothetical protein